MRKEWLDKADELKKEGQFEKAIEYYDRIIDANLDGNGWAHNLKGCSLMVLGRLEDAVESFKRASELDPESDYKYDMGRALYELGRRDEARSAFRRVARRSYIYGLDKKAKEWLERMDKEEKSSPKEEPSTVTFDSLDSFKEMIRGHYNLANSKSEGTIEADTLLQILNQIQDDVSLYWKESQTFIHSSVLDILVFPRNQFGGNMSFLGLGIFIPRMLNKYLQEFGVGKDDIGLVGGQIMSRFGFSMYHDNSQSKEWVEKNYELVDVEELERIVEKRRAELGLL